MTHAWIAFLPNLTGRDWLELILLFVALYVFLRFLRRTIAGGIFKGPAMLSWILILGLFLLLRAAELDVLNAILGSAFPVFIIALVVTFQMELRHGIARLGNIGLFRRLLGPKSRTPAAFQPVDEMIRALREAYPHLFDERGRWSAVSRSLGDFESEAATESRNDR